MLIPFIISTIAGLSTLLGSLVIFFKIKYKNINKFIVLILSISFIIMIGISIIDLIPISFINLLMKYKLLYTILLTIFFFIVGLLIVKLLSKLVANNNKNLYKLGILNMLVLICHNYPEGIITFVSSYTDITLGIKLSIGIILHNIAEGMCISVPIYYATKSKFKAIIYSLIAGLSEPFGALCTYLFLKDYITNDILDFIMIITGGMMITLSINEIFPRIIKDKTYFFKGIFIGILWLVILNVIFN